LDSSEISVEEFNVTPEKIVIDKLLFTSNIDALLAICPLPIFYLDASLFFDARRIFLFIRTLFVPMFSIAQNCLVSITFLKNYFHLKKLIERIGNRSAIISLYYSFQLCICVIVYFPTTLVNDQKFSMLVFT